MKNLLKVTLLMLFTLTLSTPSFAEQESFPLKWKKSQIVISNSVAKRTLGGPVVAAQTFAFQNGIYRMYFHVMRQGIGYAQSTDGVHWNLKSVVLRNRGIQNQDDFIVSHPWLLKLPDGRWRMYYQNIRDRSRIPNMRIKSAISNDGINFKIEPGIRLDIGQTHSLGIAGHGRTFINKSGKYIMIFSGNRLGQERQPSDIMVAISDDGLNFKVINYNVARGGHDPGITRLKDGRWAAVYALYRDTSYVMYSQNGRDWNQKEKLQILDPSGSPFVADVSILKMPDGSFKMYGNGGHGPNSSGIVLYESVK